MGKLGASEEGLSISPTRLKSEIKHTQRNGSRQQHPATQVSFAWSKPGREGKGRTGGKLSGESWPECAKSSSREKGERPKTKRPTQKRSK